MDLINRLSNFNNKVGTWVRDTIGIAQANAPIVNPVYSLFPAWFLAALTLPSFFLIPIFIVLCILAVILIRHEMVRERESVWAVMEATKQYDPELYKTDWPAEDIREFNRERDS